MQNIIFCWLHKVLLLLTAVTYPVYAQDISTSKIVKVIKSDSDSRAYRYLTLSNDVKVLLISDAKAEKSAAVLNVRVGSNQDPSERPGMAHFLEHMLFLGSEKYPIVGEYQEFIRQHGGSIGAHTAPENTHYFFDIGNKYLEPALDRFAQFFIAPAFTADYVEREKNAINTEFLAKVTDEELRERDVYRNFFNPEHPAAQFPAGNLDALVDRADHSIHDDLLSFYQTFYSANLMALVVIGNDSLNNLQKIVETHFIKIPNYNKTAINASPALFSAGLLPLSVSIRPVTELRKLTVIFPILRNINDARTKPWDYLEHLLSGDAPGSLLSLLKSLGWAKTLIANELMTGQKDGLFQVSIALTKEGVKAKDQIVSALFENFKMIGLRGVLDWRFNELKQIADLNFRFSEKPLVTDSVIELAQSMHDYPDQEVLMGPRTYANFDEGAIRQALSYLRKDNAMIVFVGPEVTGSAVTTYYQTPYSYVSGIPEVLELKPAYRQRLLLPERNIFIPKNTLVKPPLVLSGSDGILEKNIPRLLMNREQFKLWFMQDQYFRSPKAELRFRFKLPIQNGSLENAARTQLFIALVMDQLNDYAYHAKWAGLTFSMQASARGFDMAVSGYTDKQNLLVSKIIDAISRAEFSQSRFDTIKNDLIRDWRNDDKNMSYELLLKKIPRLQFLPYWGEREYAEAAQSISFESFKSYGSKLLNGAKIEALVYGNLYSQDAIKLAALMEHQLLQKQSARLPQLAKILRSENKNNKSWLYLYPLEHKDHAVVLYVQAPSPKAEDAAHMMLLSQILRSDFYRQFGVDKQLSHVTDHLLLPLKNIESCTLVVHSSVAEGEEIIVGINNFLVNASVNLTANFTEKKNALLSRLREMPVSLTAQAEKYWESILLNDTDFSRNQELIASANRITPDSLRAYYESVFLQKNRRLWLTTDKVENLKFFEYIQNVADYQQIQQGYLYP